MPAHKHAHLMKLYWQDAEETETPWQRWEWSDSHLTWRNLTNHPSWCDDWEYRRKPRTININGHEVPEPERAPLKPGAFYYIPDLIDEDDYSASRWDGSAADLIWLKHGIIHTNREAAEAHARALLSFTETKETA